MKSILISINPQWVEKILNGEKTIEIRKTKPSCELPVKVYIYCTKPKKWYHVTRHLCTSDELLYKVEDKVKMSNGFEYYGCLDNYYDILNGKVVAEFTLKEVEDFSKWEYDFGALVRHLDLWAGTRGNYPFLIDYLKRQKKGYAWHIDDLVVYDKPKELSEFYTLKKCNSCASGYESSGCRYDEDCKIPVQVTRPPQSWCYVEGMGE